MKNIIPQKLKESRIKAGLSQIQAAKKLGLDSQNRISRWENGHAKPSVTNFLRLCEI